MTSAPVLEASTWHVQFPFKLVGSVCTPSLWEVVLIFVHGPSSLATSWSSVFHFANNLGSRITNEHIQVHWKEFYFTFMQQAQLHAATKWSAFEEEQGSHTHFSTVSSLCLYPQSGESKARDPLLRSTKGEGGVCGGQSVSRFP